MDKTVAYILGAVVVVGVVVVGVKVFGSSDSATLERAPEPTSLPPRQSYGDSTGDIIASIGTALGSAARGAAPLVRALRSDGSTKTGSGDSKAGNNGQGYEFGAHGEAAGDWEDNASGSGSHA